jgi:5'-nucleotidase
VVTGPNVGNNLGSTTAISGTVGAASAGALAGIPAVAFSADTGSQVSYTTLAAGDYQYIYAGAAVRLVSALTTVGTPYLPSGTALNVNFPAAGAGTSCTSASSFKFVLSRVYSTSGATVATCGAATLPTESSVVARSGCYASVSVFDASTKKDTSSANQATVFNKLGSFLTC